MAPQSLPSSNDVYPCPSSSQAPTRATSCMGCSTLSVGKMSDAGYYTIFEPGNRGVAVYDANQVKIQVNGDALLRGWQEASGLWRVLLPTNSNPTSPQTAHLQRDALCEAAHNLFDLPSAEKAIRYLHACLGFPTKATWLAAIRRGSFVGWTLVTVASVNAHFPE
ncbi:LOW QUALITY PROTEIN: hypothetical protein ACHAWF_005413 [Thalassiosira exigua]